MIWFLASIALAIVVFTLAVVIGAAAWVAYLEEEGRK